ncbi:hypothetical protein LCGC14_1950330 [marine sediment metagenome]|uniref:Uncharacterized protein n=1 Tax=marine sediment metagenome TaxID=412755 RepID=A0A0F9FHL4_9ZZZZ
MSKANPAVSTVTKVKEGRHTYQYDLSDGKLVIEYRHGKKVPVRVVFGEFSLAELRKLLVGTLPAAAALAVVERPPGSIPKEGIQGEETAEGLLRTPDGVESGMEE